MDITYVDQEYLDKKVKEILMFLNSPSISDEPLVEKLIRELLIAIWFAGKSQGVQHAREVLKGNYE